MLLRWCLMPRSVRRGPFGLLEVVRGDPQAVHRHPHVFGDETAETPRKSRNWDSAKRAEKQREGVMEDCPWRCRPGRAARITGGRPGGYDFSPSTDAFDKFREGWPNWPWSCSRRSVPGVPAEVDAEVIEGNRWPTTCGTGRGGTRDVCSCLGPNCRGGESSRGGLRRSSEVRTGFPGDRRRVGGPRGGVQGASLVEMEEVYQAAKAAEK
ncbi:MAG: hypothetical protein Ct9H300mP1_01520 [Planctomycetaceae bacterium]|nr:MAG: hypothetical protein Ct9H300mP1_01520 [Planctomycetaceae bacterium]